MTKFFDLIGTAITSLAAVIFVLMLTVVSMTCFSHTLFFQIFPSEMVDWEKSVATWALACAWELTVLICCTNITHINRSVPTAMAICSGLILILFLHGFEPGLSPLQYFERWFIGILVATISMTFSSLFYKKWCLATEQKSLLLQSLELQKSYELNKTEMVALKADLAKSKVDLEQLFVYTDELEKFKAKEIKKLTCNCGIVHESVYALNSHKVNCQINPTRVKKLTIYDTPKDH